MKKLLTLAVISLFIASGVSATVLVDETFTYADGPLVGNGGWTNHSGGPDDLLVAGGLVVIEHGIPSEDAHVLFTAPAGVIYFGFDFSVDDLGHAYAAGGDYEYFAHFKDSGYGFAARMDIVPALGGGDYSVGIGSDDSVADAIWPTDLSYGVVYHVVVSYDQDFNIAELWIDPTADTDPSILGDDQPDPGDAIVAFALRQSDSTENEIIRVDNLLVSDAFNDACPECPPVATDNSSWGEVKSLYR